MAVAGDGYILGDVGIYTRTLSAPVPVAPVPPWGATGAAGAGARGCGCTRTRLLPCQCRETGQGSHTGTVRSACGITAVCTMHLICMLFAAVPCKFGMDGVNTTKLWEVQEF